LKIVASAILADVEPGVPPGGKTSHRSQLGDIGTFPQCERIFPGGKMPPSTAGGTPAATLLSLLTSVLH